MSLRVGADVGGTFTDIVVIDDAGGYWRHKTPSTPPNYEFAVLTGLGRLLRDNGHAAGDVVEVTHGTTVATNALLEHRGARTALITTRGFRDVLELRRMRAPQMYDLFFEKPKALIERYLRFEVSERLSATGEVLVPLDESDLAAIVGKLTSENIESVAVCFLHAYAYPEHEIQAGKFLRTRLPEVDVTLSSEVLRERREYERTATVAVNAYVRPVMKRYLGALRDGLRRMEVRAPLLIMQSTGGLTSDEDAAERPVFALESGPAAGVLASLERAQAAGIANAIAFDMGGTTAKASLIENGKVGYCPEYEVGASMSTGSLLVGGGGELIRAPSINIAEVGAGGGSIARVDAAGRFLVGPTSAGAIPGPVCYGRGGSQPTVTDANAVLGYLPTGDLADGHIRIDSEAARRAVHDCVAKPLGLSLLAAAEGIHRLANAQIMRTLRAVSTQRGRDARQFALIAYGGSGPIHAAPLARELGVSKILIPPLPGLFSAVGLLCSDLERHDIRSCFLHGESLRTETIAVICAELAQGVQARFAAEGFAPAAVELNYSVDVRFQGQSMELRVPLDDPKSNPGALAGVRSAFAMEYERLYGRTAELNGPLEVVAIRLVGRIRRSRNASLRLHDAVQKAASPRTAYFSGRLIEVPVVSRSSLSSPLSGPLLIDEYDSTTVVPPGMSARLDQHGNILLEGCHA